MGQYAAQLDNKAYWSAFAEQGLCLAEEADKVKTFEDVDGLRSESPAGVYLIVGFKEGSVTTLYVGQSNDVFRRTLEHRVVC